MDARLARALQSPALGGNWQGKGGQPTNVAPQRVELARVRVPPELAQPWTVTGGGVAPHLQGQKPAEIWRTYAEVTWGQGGAFITAEIDWRQGFRLNVAGSEVRVTVVVPEAFPLVVAQDFYEVNFPCVIAPGATAQSGRLTRTRYIGTIIPTANGNVWVPPLAYQFYVACDCVGVPPAPALTITQRAGNPPGPLQDLCDASLAATPNRNRADWPQQHPTILMPETTWITLTNNGAVNANNCRVLFELAL